MMAVVSRFQVLEWVSLADAASLAHYIELIITVSLHQRMTQAAIKLQSTSCKTKGEGNALVRLLFRVSLILKYIKFSKIRHTYR